MRNGGPFTFIVTLAIGLSLCGKLCLFLFIKEKLVAVFVFVNIEASKTAIFWGIHND